MDPLTRLALDARDGDSAALERLIEATQAEVWRFIAYLAGPGDADDLTQDAYLRAIGSLRRFDADSSVRTWLLVIARRTVVDHWRKRSRIRRRDARVTWAASTDDSSATLALESLVSSLPPEFREVFVLTQIVGLQYSEVAEVLGVPVGTVRSRVARARERLATDVTKARLA